MKKLILIIVLLFSSTLYAQQEYGLADFSRNDYFTHDQLVACWDSLDPGVRADIFQGHGSFENWASPNCPDYFVCTTNGSSTISEETSILYDNDSSVKLVTDNVGNWVSISAPACCEKGKVIC